MKLALRNLTLILCLILHTSLVSAAPKLDTKQFTLDMHEALKNTGYVMQLQQHGKAIQSIYWGWAKIPKLTAYNFKKGVPWGPDIQMNAASLAKLITTMGLTKLINDRQDIDPNLGFDSLIINYLPAHWKKGPNINKIRLCDLLTHRSGFRSVPYFSHFVDYGQMKARVMMGISKAPNNTESCSFGLYPMQYQNINFALLRIIMPIIQYRAALYNLSIDSLLDLQTQVLHHQYMQETIFKPAGVYNARTTKTAITALGYQAYVATKSYKSAKDYYYAPEGFNSGNNMSQYTGSSGWHLSVNELLKIISAFRRGGKYMNNKQAEEILTNGYGIDRTSYSNGWSYAKNGFENDFDKVNSILRKEQAVVYFLPEDMELAIYVNSPIPEGDKLLLNIVEDLYSKNIK